MDLGGYTPSSAQALREALDQAEALGEYPTAEEVQAAMEAMQLARTGLEADRTALQKGMSRAEILLLQAGRYTEDSLQALEAALNQAKAIYDKQDASVAEIKTAADALESAEAELVSIQALLVTRGSGSGFYAEKQTVTVAADTPQPGQRFVKWQAEGITLEDASQAQIQFAMPANAVALTATYEEIPVISVTDAASGISISGRITSQAGLSVKEFAETDAGYAEMKDFLGGQDVIGAYVISGLSYDGAVTVTFPTDPKWDGKMLTILQKRPDGSIQMSHAFAGQGNVSVKAKELSAFLIGTWQADGNGVTIEQLQKMLEDVQEAREAAEKAQDGAEAERLKAEEAVLNARIEQKKAEEAKEAAEKAQKEAEEAKKAAEEAKKAAEEARKEAEKAQEEARKEAEEARKAAEAERLAAEKALKEAQEAQKKAEEAWKEAQKAVESIRKMLKSGKVYTIGSYKYKVLNGTAKVPTVVLYRAVKKNMKTASIPATVKIKNITCKVVRIEPYAFRGQKKLQKVVVGANVRRIRSKAFYGAKKLKKIEIKSKVLATADKNALQGIASKVTVKVPKNFQKKYQKLLAGKGAKVTIK